MQATTAGSATTRTMVSTGSKSRSCHPGRAPAHTDHHSRRRSGAPRAARTSLALRAFVSFVVATRGGRHPPPLTKLPQQLEDTLCMSMARGGHGCTLSKAREVHGARTTLSRWPFPHYLFANSPLFARTTSIRASLSINHPCGKLAATTSEVAAVAAASDPRASPSHLSSTRGWRRTPKPGS